MVGEIVLPLFAAPTSGLAGAINVSGTARVTDLTGTLRGNFAGFVTALKAGNIYANAHTTANPIGEIRGVVVVAAAAVGGALAQATPAAPKTGNAGLSGARGSAAIVAVLIVLAVGAVIGGRMLSARRR